MHLCHLERLNNKSPEKSVKCKSIELQSSLPAMSVWGDQYSSLLQKCHSSEIWIITYEQGHIYVYQSTNITTEQSSFRLLQCMQAPRSTKKKYVQNNGLCSFEAKKNYNAIKKEESFWLPSTVFRQCADSASLIYPPSTRVQKSVIIKQIFTTRKHRKHCFLYVQLYTGPKKW